MVRLMHLTMQEPDLFFVMGRSGINRNFIGEVSQGFDKNLSPHTFCCHTLRVHDIVWRMGFTRALLSTPILQTIS